MDWQTLAVIAVLCAIAAFSQRIPGQSAMIIFVYPGPGVLSILTQYMLHVLGTLSAQEARPVADVDDPGRPSAARSSASAWLPGLGGRARALGARPRLSRAGACAPCAALRQAPACTATAARLGWVISRLRTRSGAMTRPKRPIAAQRHCRSATSPGCSAPTPAIRRPPSPTSSTARTSPRARPASPSPSICRRRPATTPTTSWRAARSARSACRSRTWATCARCSTASRSAQMNTSMTINATAAWLLALYVAVADEQGTDRASLTGTIQNDIIKEYLSRGTYVFPPEPSLRLIKDTIVFTCGAMPKWNPTNVCSYHLQEAGATPVQELAFALATAQAVLDAVQGLRRGGAGRFRRRRRPHLVLRQRGPAVHHRDLQDARLHRAVGRDHGRALRRRPIPSTACSATACRSTRWA